MKTHILSLLFFSFILLYGCSGVNEGIYLYNPLDHALTLKINDKEHVIEMGSMIKVPGKEGTYTLKSIYQDSVLLDTTIELSSDLIYNGVLLNIANESLYLLKEKYGSEMSQQIESLIPKDSAYYARQAHRDSVAEANGTAPAEDRSAGITIVDTLLLIGDIKEFPAKQVIIPREWDIDPNKSFPETIDVKANSGETMFGKTISKLFGKHDLIKYYDDNDMLIQ